MISRKELKFGIRVCKNFSSILITYNTKVSGAERENKRGTAYLIQARIYGLIVLLIAPASGPRRLDWINKGVKNK